MYVCDWTCIVLRIHKSSRSIYRFRHFISLDNHVCVHAFQKRAKKILDYPDRKKNTSLFQTGSIIASTLYALMQVSFVHAYMKKHELNITAAASCSKQNKESCLKIDYWLTFSTEIKYKNQDLACELGNKTACPSRSPASIKKNLY